ncbi:MAG: hypothetical protein EOO89_12080 [Pedobacter sp.]|nr:MAG: hypothetical protein EOO89_12080 [Pedobacter sp.]
MKRKVQGKEPEWPKLPMPSMGKSHRSSDDSFRNLIGAKEWHYQALREAFDVQSEKYLDKLWNQISSGSYMPPAIKF